MGGKLKVKEKTRKKGEKLRSKRELQKRNIQTDRAKKKGRNRRTKKYEASGET